MDQALNTGIAMRH